MEGFESMEDRLMKLLKEKGAEDSIARSLLIDWTKEQENLVERSKEPRLAQIEFNLRRARLYFKAGFSDESLENFEDARMQAWHERERYPEIYEKIKGEMDSFGF